MEQAMFPQNENNTPFDNEALFDAEGTGQPGGRRAPDLL